jgi:uncharacterized protein
VIAVDTNILIYAHRKDSEWNEVAHAALARLAEGRALWAIPWPCVHEFVAIATHPKIFSPPSTLDQALQQVEAWLASPSVVLLAEEGEYWPELAGMLKDAKVRGPQVHDARIAALCRLHGVQELWTADRDFTRLKVTTRNPLVS